MSEGFAFVAAVQTGDRIRFHPDSSSRRIWTVRDTDKRFIVATAPAPFQPKGTLVYTVVDLTGWAEKHYNGAGKGPTQPGTTP